MSTIYVTHPRYADHDSPGHPEHAGRIRAVWRRLDDSGLIARMNAVEAEAIDENLLLTVHTQSYLELLNRLPGYGRTVHLDTDTYANPQSYEIARLAAGGTVRAVDAILSGAAANGLAVVRPPGHHAMPDHGMGFCLLNNVAIAARYAQQLYGIERVLIVDYDVHHGNGTEAMFFDDPSVLFISTHQSPLYPGSGALEDIGAGAGRGATVNIPLPSGHGDATYSLIFEAIVWKLAQRFQPGLILVSAGFDAHWVDPLAAMQLSLTGYAHLSTELVRMAQALCGGKIAFVLEGGYNLDSLSYGVSNVARVLLGDTPVDPLGAAPSPREPSAVQPLIDNLRRIHNL